MADLSNGAPVLLSNASLPTTLVEGSSMAPDFEGLARADILILDGRIAAVGPVGSITAEVPRQDLDGGQVWPAPLDMHTHLDKGHIWPRARVEQGLAHEAPVAVARDRTANWSAEDVARRFDFALRCAWAHGTGAIRTHIDSYGAQAPITWPVFARLRAEWAGRIALQGVALTSLDHWCGPEGAALADLVADHEGVLGGVVRFFDDPLAATGKLDEGLDRLLALAAERGLDIDLHVDESDDPGTLMLDRVAHAVLRNGFQGKVTCGHCCTLALQDETTAQHVIARVAEAGITVVSLPMVNLYRQGRRPGRSPMVRGITLLPELAAAGVPVVAASDNCRDPFYAFGDLDLIEVFRETIRIGQLDTPYGDWPRAVTRTSADTMRLPDRGRIGVGRPADLILFRARSMTELLSRPQSDRTVLRRGRAVAALPPDYRELDDLFQPAVPAPV